MYGRKSHNMQMVGKDGGLALLIVTIGDDSIMKTRTHMATIPTDLDPTINNLSSEEDEGKNAEPKGGGYKSPSKSPDGAI